MLILKFNMTSTHKESMFVDVSCSLSTALLHAAHVSVSMLAYNYSTYITGLYMHVCVVSNNRKLALHVDSNLPC